MTSQLSREVAVVPSEAALLFIDVQNYGCHENGGEFAGLSAAERDEKFGYFFSAFNGRALPNMVRLRQACRDAGIEIIYTVIESMTRDGRDRSLDYKISGFNVPRGSWDAKMVDELLPADDEMVFPKTSSSVFISTNIDYVLRNLGSRYLLVAGCLTDQCVDSAVRDACDLGYLVTTVTDACVTMSEERHLSSLRNSGGYSRHRTTDAIIAELSQLAENG